MLGIIVHWGLYSIPAYDDIASARRRSKHSGGGSEWIYKRLLVKEGDFRPPSGWKPAQKYFLENFAGMEYEDLCEEFDAKVDFDQWMDTFKKAGASYVILTARHHDGFCLWRAKNDYVKQFRDAAIRHNLKWGIYYSWIEFSKNFTKSYVEDIVKPQIEELKSYRPDIWWFDGHWGVKTKLGQEFVSNFVKILKKEYPGVEINDRLGEEYRTRKEDLNWLGDATYRNFEDRYLPTQKPTVPWEHINTIGLSWGRNEEQTPVDYKTGKELRELYEKVQGLGGRLLLNIAPDGRGILDPIEVERLNEMNLIK